METIELDQPTIDLFNWLIDLVVDTNNQPIDPKSIVIDNSNWFDLVDLVEIASYQQPTIEPIELVDCLVSQLFDWSRYNPTILESIEQQTNWSKLANQPIDLASWLVDI